MIDGPGTQAINFSFHLPHDIFLDLTRFLWLFGPKVEVIGIFMPLLLPFFPCMTVHFTQFGSPRFFTILGKTSAERRKFQSFSPCCCPSVVIALDSRNEKATPPHQSTKLFFKTKLRNTTTTLLIPTCFWGEQTNNYKKIMKSKAPGLTSW